MKNILLVQVVDNYGPNKFLPLAIAYQWLNAAQHPQISKEWNLVDVLIEKVDIDQYVNSINHDLDVVAMSSYVWNWNFNNELAKQIKQRWPNCIVVVGGPEVHKRDPDLIRNRPWLDVAVLGENEPAFQSILLDLDLEKITKIPGVVTRYTTEIFQPTRTQNLETIPSPILSGFYDRIIDRYREKNIPVKYWQLTWETMRGCPYHCAFCDIGDEYWNKAMWFDLDRIYKEIDWMGQNKIEYLSVCDSNWGIHPRDVEITQYIIETKKRTGYPKILDVTWAKQNPGRVKHIVQMGHAPDTNLLRGFNLSLQSLDSQTLKINSRFNLQNNTLYESLRWYKENNVPTYTELIWPLPGETLISFCQGLQNLIDLGQRNFIVIHPLVVTNNSPLGQPEFRQAQEIVTAVVPVDTFWLNVPDLNSYIVEKEEVAISTATVTYEDYVSGNMIGHWVGVMYYYGWAHGIMQYLRSQHGIKEMDFIQSLIEYFQNKPDTLIGREHAATVASYRAVFERKEFWGRLLDEPYNGLYWEYKSGTCVVFYQHRDELAQCLNKFLCDVYDIDRSDLVKLNLELCVNHNQQYPFVEKYDPVLTKAILNIDSGEVEFDHRDTSLIDSNMDERQFVTTVYHYRRKTSYWRCNTRDVALTYSPGT